jgi:hypothetical protein
VVPIALCSPGDALHLALRRYKDATVGEARRYFSARLAGLVGRFLDVHGHCLAGAGVEDFESVASVPSSSRPSFLGAHPLQGVISRVAPLSGLPRAELVRGISEVGHFRASPGAFEVRAVERRSRVLVVEDTWVTGANALSAVAALSAGGATVVGVLVIGRMVDPGASAGRAQWWDRVTSVGGDALHAKCCLEGARK